MSKNLKSVFSSKAGILLALAVAAVLVIAPKVKNSVMADTVTCPNVPTTPAINANFPVSMGGEPCTNYPTVFGFKNNVRPSTVAEATNISANGGDEIIVRVFAHNSAADGSPAATNVHLSLSVDGNSGSSHTISGLVESANAGKADGKINVQTSGDTQLQVVDAHLEDWFGNVNSDASVSVTNSSANVTLSSINACFQFSKFMVVRVKVVSAQQPQSASINASLGAGNTNTCLFNATVTWQSTGYPNVAMFVKDPSGQLKVVAGATNGTETVPWIQPDKHYEFTLWTVDTSSGSYVPVTKIAGPAVIDAPSLNCGVTPPPPAETLSCSISPNPAQINQSVLVSINTNLSGTFNWSAPGVNALISSGTLNLGTPLYLSYATAGTKTVTVSMGSKTATCSVVIKETPVQASFNLSITPNPVCVGQKSTYTISNAVGLEGKQIFWSSTKNGVSTGEHWAGYSGQVIQNGFWTAQSANAWTADQVGTWTKTATFFDSSFNIIAEKTVSFVVQVCEQPPQNFTATATATASASATASCPDGTTATATASASASATATSNISQQDAQNKAQAQAQANAQAQAQANAQASASAQCSTVSQKGLLLLTKEVRNVTQNTSFSHVTNAKTGETVEYRITVAAGTAVELNNVRVTDTFASGLSFINGSLTVNGQPSAPGLSTGGLVFSKVTQTPIVIKYQSTVTATNGSLVNTAHATADNASNSPSDQATVNVIFVQPGQPALTIIKQVKNVTQNTGFGTSINAVKNDVLTYQIVVTNSGSATATNVVISDSNPIGLQNIRSLQVSKSSTGSITNGIMIGSLAAGETVTITYDATVSIESGTIFNTATVSADNAATRTASAVVNVTTTVIPTPSGNNTTITNNTCVNNSCNTTTTTNNTTNITNITTTNNTFFINTAGTTSPISELRQLSVTKNVRNITSGTGTFSHSANANNGDTVEFEILVTNTGNQVVNNVRLNDTWTGGLDYVSGSTRIDGSSSGDIWSGNTLSLGSLFTGQQKRITFQARVNSASGTTIQNTAIVSGDNAATVQDTAFVFVSNVAGSNVNLTFSKKAFNDTKGADATSVIASKEDFITYTLTVTNSGNAPATNFVITDDLSQVLPLADIVDNGGGTVSGNVISYPGLTIPAGGSVSKSFKVRVKFFLAENLSFVMTNTYGNTVTVRINVPQVKGAFIAPKTGADTRAFLFASLFTSGFALIKKKKYLMKLIFS